jgi:von Willebrand factor A domain-containing protein 7
MRTLPTTLAAIVLVLLAAGAAAPSWAFCPKNGLLCAATAKSSGSLTHQDITQRAIEALDKRYFGVGKLTKPMQTALDQIIEANAKVDDDQVTSAKHFDGENGAGGNARLAILKANIIAALQADPINATGARANLGGALHTIQDFYSHTNWVEQGNTGAHPGVGRPGALAFAGPLATTCSGFTDTGPLCANSSNLATDLLTSGYYGGEDRIKPGAFKCSHGGPLDKSSPSSDPLGYFREGINKDTRYCDLSPHSGFHNAAAGAAIAGTQQFVEDIKAVITVTQLKALLGAGPTLAFAIDTTGSMGSIIAGVRNSAINIVNRRLGTDEEPLQYVLAPFNDPGTGPTTSTTDATAFKASISGLGASGGGDCPELAMTGMYNGLSLSNPSGSLFMYTDASAKDAGLAGAVIGLAKAKEIKVFAILFGSCSPIEPGYLQLATETGGQAISLFSSEAESVTTLADLLGRNNAVQILSVNDSYAAPKTHTFPVDASMTRLTVSVSSIDYTTPAVTLVRPDGVTVQPADASTYLTLTGGVIISIDAPMRGRWQLQVAGSAGLTYVNVGGTADLAFSSFKLATFAGQPPHQGLFALDGEPGPGQHLYALASLTSGAADAAYTLRRKDYAAIMPLPLERDETDPNIWFGPLTVPAEPFLAYVTGMDSSGTEYQRVMSLMVSPQQVAILAPPPQDLRPGVTTSLVFQVRNLGAPDTFHFAATDDQHFIVAVPPTTLTLGTGETANVMVQLQPPAGTAAGVADTITAAVQSTVNALSRNSATVTSFVTGQPQVAGRPDFIADIVGQETVAPGVTAVDLRFTNTGVGTARDMTLSALRVRTLAGTGTATLNTALSPPLPFVTPNVDVGNYFTVRLTFNTPPGLLRFSISATGTVSDINGATYAYSHAQAVTPR